MSEKTSVKEAISGVTDCCGVEGGTVEPAASQPDPLGRYFRTDGLPVGFDRIVTEGRGNLPDRYAGLESDHMRELKQLSEENARLKQLVAELSLDKAELQDVLSKRFSGPRL